MFQAGIDVPVLIEDADQRDDSHGTAPSIALILAVARNEVYGEPFDLGLPFGY